MTTEQPNEQDIPTRIELLKIVKPITDPLRVIYTAHEVNSLNGQLVSAILKHTRSVEAIEKAIGGDEFPADKDEWHGEDQAMLVGRDELREEIRAALGLGGQDV